MKKIDKLVFTSMLPPYLLAFFVAEFVLVMQFLWKYIDEIIGKGISFFVLIELIFYFAVTIIPLAIPLTVLISSVMVFGNLGERYELSSMKSAGVSLLRIMGAAILISIFTGCFSLLASNYLKPKANYKFYYRFNSVRKQKPSLSITPLVFNDDFKDMVMRVGSKGKDGKKVDDILIYDHSKPDKSEVQMISAKTGEMFSSEDGKQFYINLENGTQYSDGSKNKKAKNTGSQYRPFVRTEFGEWRKVFDMSEFEMEASNLNLTRKTYDLMNTFQLKDAIDSFALRMDSVKTKSGELYTWMNSIQDYRTEVALEEAKIPSKEDSIKAVNQAKYKHRKPKGRQSKFIKQNSILSDSTTSIAMLYTAQEAVDLLASSTDDPKKLFDRHKIAKGKVKTINKDRNKHILRFHQQYSWALICIIFLFIGAPLGSIVKKGGYGYPLLFAILFFMMFIILNILGEKLNKGGTIHPALGAWLPCLVLTPFSIYLTYKALNDAAFDEFSKLKEWVVSIFRKFSKQSI